MTGTAQLTPVPRLAVLGAGHVGATLARVAAEAGIDVSVAASGDPARIELITQVLAPGALPRWAADAVAGADVVVLAIPLHRFATVEPGLVAGKVVVDAMNYWPPVDGVQEMFDDDRYGSSEIVATRLAASTVVKSFNHIGYHELESERRPAGRPTAVLSASRRTIRQRRPSSPRWSSASATTPSSSTRCGPDAPSNPAARCSARC
jgi:predicted dinucleotide-binding enzyme